MAISKKKKKNQSMLRTDMPEEMEEMEDMASFLKEFKAELKTCLKGTVIGSNVRQYKIKLYYEIQN